MTKKTMKPIGWTPILATSVALFIVKFVLAFALIVARPDVFMYGDTFEYVRPAEAWFASGRYVSAIGGPAETFRLPGYPAFLVPFQLLDAGYRYQVASLCQITLTHAWLLVVGLWIGHRFGTASALAFLMILSLTTPWIHYPATIHSDTQFAILTFTAVLLTAEASVVDRWRSILLLGAAGCWAAAAVTRADLLGFPAWMAVIALISMVVNRRLTAAPRIDVKAQWVWVAATAGAIVLWSIRNLLIAGRFVYTTFLDTVVEYVETSGGSARPQDTLPHVGTRLTDIVVSVFEHVDQILATSVPRMINIFFNPNRWYFHRYVDALGIPVESAGRPLTEIGYSGLAWQEWGYIAFVATVSITVVSTFGIFLWQLLRGRLSVPWFWIVPFLLVLSYLFIHKTIWVAFSDAANVRFAMSMYPFIVFLASLAVAKPPKHLPPALVGDDERAAGYRLKPIVSVD